MNGLLTEAIKDQRSTRSYQRSYQCDIAVCQQAKLQMLEFYYHFLVKYLNKQATELCYIYTDSFYLAMSVVTL